MRPVQPMHFLQKAFLHLGPLDSTTSGGYFKQKDQLKIFFANHSPKMYCKKVLSSMSSEHPCRGSPVWPQPRTCSLGDSHLSLLDHVHKYLQKCCENWFGIQWIFFFFYNEKTTKGKHLVRWFSSIFTHSFYCWRPQSGLSLFRALSDPNPKKVGHQMLCGCSWRGAVGISRIVLKYESDTSKLVEN